MSHQAKGAGAMVLRLIMGLALLGWPRVGSAQGTWSVIATAGSAVGQVNYPDALAMDPAGNLYVADVNYRIQKRDAQGSWSIIATAGDGLGQVYDPSALSVDAMGNLYVADNLDRIQRRDAQGTWSEIDNGQVSFVSALAVDASGSLYVAEAYYHSRIHKLDAQGNWSEIPPPAPLCTCNWDRLRGYSFPAIAVDTAGNLYVDVVEEYVDAPDAYFTSIQKRDAQGNWSVIAESGTGLGQIYQPTALAADSTGNLYVADSGWIQRRDSQGNWSVIATTGSALGQVQYPSALAVDTAGNLYVADTGNNRVLKSAPGP
jgi:tripartite motif-containing protein 71